MIAFAKPDNVIAMPTKSNEWYTPPAYIEAARHVMGGIDLDPASCEKANRTVKATQYFTRHDNGLMHSWHGNVWLNPPFGKISGCVSWQAEFSRKLLSEYESGHIQQATALFMANITKKWFQPLLRFPVCIVQNGHIKFQREHDVVDDFRYGICIIYLGANEQAFIDIFSEFGNVVKLISKPKERPVTLSLWGDA